jgi:hypothetical protein
MNLNSSIADIPLPARLARRPISERGFPVPWFVSFRGGKWDFVNLDPRNIGEAYRRNICWLCGEPLGRFKAFVIGPMCAINRVSSEPPSHRECAEYAVRACPFLARPNARRNEAAAINHGETVPGVMIQHNPEASLIWITKSYKPINTPKGALFQIGDPIETLWFKQGRPATSAEVRASVDKGLPYLRRIAALEGAEAEAELDRQIARAMPLLPAE